MQALAFNPDRDIETLLKKHRKEIDKLRELTKDVLDVKLHDDIFLLRYILSNGSAKDSEEAVRYTIAFRKDPKVKYFYDMLARGEEIPNVALLQEMGLSPSGMHKSSLDGGPVQLVRQGCIEFAPLLDIWTDEEMLRFNNLQKEQAWIICDRVTRQTGRLVKLTIINDFRGMKFQRPPQKWMKAFGDSSKIAEKVYPQLVETTVMLNTPTWFNMMMKVVKFFLSKRLMEKFRMCNGDTDSGDITQCPYVRNHINVDDIPSYLGGKCECKGGCVFGLPNQINKPLPMVPTEDQVEMVKTGIEERRKIDTENLRKLGVDI